MKSSSEYFPVVLFNVPVQGSSNFGVCMWMKSASVSIRNSTVLWCCLLCCTMYPNIRYGMAGSVFYTHLSGRLNFGVCGLKS